jgi:hypothetical protein
VLKCTVSLPVVRAPKAVSDGTRADDAHEGVELAMPTTAGGKVHSRK